MTTNSSKKGLALTIAGASMLGLGAGAMSNAQAATATPVQHVFKKAGVTIPSNTNPMARYKSTGVVSTKVIQFDLGTWTTIRYSDGDQQQIIQYKPGSDGTRAISNTTIDSNGDIVRFLQRSNPKKPSLNQSRLNITYVATTKSAANVRTGPSTKNSINKTLPAGTIVKFNHESVTGSFTTDDTMPGWGMTWGNSDKVGDFDGFIAESTLNIVPLT